MNLLTRRNFIKTGAAAATASALPPRFTAAAETAAQPQLVLPTPAQVAWQDAEVGIIYDFDLAIAAGDTTENNAARKTWDPNLYQPDKLDTDQWLAAAKAAGAGYAIFTATHFNGFMQWQSDLYPYGLKQTKWRDGKGDVVGDFVASCRACRHQARNLFQCASQRLSAGLGSLCGLGQRARHAGAGKVQPHCRTANGGTLLALRPADPDLV